MRYLTVAALAMLGSVGLSGCAQLGIGVPDMPHSYVSDTLVRNDFSLGALYRVTTGRHLPVRVIGQPFPGVAPIDFAQDVVTKMPNGFLNHGSYMVDPGGIAGVGVRIIWNFDPDPRSRGNDVCLSHTSGITRRPGPAGQPVKIRATMALCDEGSPYVTNTGGVEATGPDDPRFIDFIAQMTTSTLLSPPQENSPSPGSGINLGL
jgi:hypothetical protein